MSVWLLLACQLLRVPDPARTPGVLRDPPLTMQQACSVQWGADRRHVTVAMKQHVAAVYGVPWADHARYEFDHLVPRELGGADAERNLWPQAWPAARVKDRLENHLHALVCAGTVPLAEAQHAIATDWLGALTRYGGRSGPR